MTHENYHINLWSLDHYSNVTCLVLTAIYNSSMAIANAMVEAISLQILVQLSSVGGIQVILFKNLFYFSIIHIKPE